ncbi:Arc family DNA-binding protein [Insolitispirillum peregrinum]|uniref:Arc family DNA-binding protein n=1 Tax=Insolitispirillum peregrinum TaxID=80876 RepID=UPI0036090693
MSEKGFMLRMPAEIHTRLKEAAAANQRSLNAEINARLRGSFFHGVFERLEWLRVHILSTQILGTESSAVALSMLAEAIGEPTPARLERIFSGIEDPTFEILDAIAARCSVSSQWLKHGVGEPQ